MYQKGHIVPTINLLYRFSEERNNSSNDWRPLADEAKFIIKPICSARIPRSYFDPDDLYVGTIRLSGLSEIAMQELVNPQLDSTLDIRFTDPKSGIAGITLVGLKAGALSCVAHAESGDSPIVFQAHCQCRRA